MLNGNVNIVDSGLVLDERIAHHETALRPVDSAEPRTDQLRSFGGKCVDGFAAVGDAADKEPAQQSRSCQFQQAGVGPARGMETGDRLGRLAVTNSHHSEFGKQMAVAILHHESGASIPSHRAPPRFGGWPVGGAAGSRLQSRSGVWPTLPGNGYTGRSSRRQTG